MLGGQSAKLVIYLNTKFGKSQIARHESGVSGQTHINKQEIESFLVPTPPINFQNSVEAEYKKVVTDYYKTMIFTDELAKKFKIIVESLENNISKNQNVD